MKIKNILFSFIVFLSAIFTAKSAEINGLVGQYYANRNLEGEPIYRVDEKIDFDWENNSPMDNIPTDSFSVRWSGYIRVPETGKYTFYVKSDDGARVWIDGELVFDYWFAQSATERSFEINMDVGKRYAIRVEYYEVNATASMQLSWESASIKKEIISEKYLTIDAANDASIIINSTQSKNVPFGRKTIVSVETSSEGFLIQWQKSVDGKSWEDVLDANQKDYETPKFEEYDSPVLYRCRVADVSNLNNILYAYTEIIRLTPAEPEIFYVSNSGSEANDGKSWNTSFSSLQKAITEAEKIGGGNIWVKAGEYDFGEAVELKSDVWIYGGFAGTEKSLEERVDGNETVISGGGTHRIFGAYSIVDAKLEGLTLTEGKCDIGSVLYLESSENILIKGVKITGNESDSQILVCNYSKVAIEGSRISNNTGRGIWIDGNAQVEIVGSVFESNIINSGGGAIATVNSSVVTIEGSEFIGNESKDTDGGALYLDGSSTYTITGSRFEGNKANWNGGAIYHSGSSVLIDGCEFISNEARYDNGGAIYVYRYSGTIICDSSTFVGNSGGYGGGVYIDALGTFRNNTFYGNVSRNSVGDAVYSGRNIMTLLNCTVVGNNTEGGRGSAISGRVSVKNCIVWGNGRYGGYNQLEVSEEVINSVIEGGYESGTNIITENPLLMPLDYYGGNVKVMPVSTGSSAIGICSTESVEPPATDALGNVRGDVYGAGAVEFLGSAEYVYASSERSKYISGKEFEIEALISGEAESYQWYKDGVEIDGATERVLKVSQSERSAVYTVKVIVGGNTVTSEGITIETRPGIVYVSGSGNDEKDGSSWENAKATLQSALSECAYGSQIWVKSGEYDFGGEIELVEGVYIYGGFSGTEKSLEERVDGSETVISGGGEHGIFRVNRQINIELDGLTLTKGKAERGGAIYIESSEGIRLSGIKVIENESDSQIWVCNYSKVGITDSQISNNTGRGIGIDGNAQVEIVGSVFESNISEPNGGAIAIVNNSVVEIRDSTFRENESTKYNGGALSVESGSSYTIMGCKFEGNVANKQGGAVYSSVSSLSIIDSKFIENFSPTTGGAIFIKGSSLNLDTCEFDSNTAQNVGGALDLDGVNTTCKNNSFYKNISATGSAIKQQGGSFVCINTTFYKNNTTGSDGNTIYSNGTSTLVNCTVAENYASSTVNSGISGRGEIINSIIWNNGEEGEKQISSGFTVTNSVVEGGYEGGTNIITENPLLMPLDYYGGNVKTIGVSFSSCTINAGATQSELGSSVTLPTVDARGADRTAFERPCIGAFEPQVSDIHSGLSMTALYGDDYFLEDYEFILSLMMFETRILDTDDLLVEWYKDGELFYSSLDSLILSDMLSGGSATYRAEMTLNGQTYSTEEFEIKTVPGVVYVSSSGDDSNDGKTPETAKRSLDALLRELPYGRPYVINVISNVSDSSEENSVFTINGMYDIPDGVTLNIGDDCILKFSDNAGLNVLPGGTLNVGNSVVFTHIADDSIGGDTNADEGRSLPQYDKYSVSGAGNIVVAEDCDWRYKSFEYGGTLEADQLWIGNRVYLVTNDIVVPNGMVLNILEGAVIKFASNKRIIVQAGGNVFVKGSYEKQVVFTSIKDDSVGGDSNGDGNASLPSMGDWGGILLDGGSGEFKYAKFRYGGGVSGNQYGAAANVFMWNSGSGDFYGCSFSDSKMDGCFSQTGYFENCVFVGNSRGLVSHMSQTRAINCVFISNGSGVFRHGGTLDAINCIMAYNTVEGSGGDSGTPNVSYSCLYNPASSNGKWSGGDGIITGDPLLRNVELEDFTLKVGSPCIDAGDGESAPESDYFGQPRVQDSHVSGVGTSSANGAIPDIGIHEMTENAMSEVDIAANWIKYPETVSVGEYIDVVWMGTNVGSKKIQGNCKTTLLLVNDSTAEELELGQITNLINLAPSESGEFSAKIKVPQTAQDGVWKIKMVANSNRGIFEGHNTDNNTIVGDTSINVEMPIFEGNSVTVDANSSATIKFSASESARCILITSPENLKIYGAARYVPNAQTFAVEATNCGNGIYALTIPASSESFYITFVNESINSKTAAIEIGENSLSILGTSIDKLPNNGNVTFSIYGTGFSDKSTVTVSSSSGSKLPASNVKFVSENELSVTLSPEYAQAGDYELVVNDGINGTAYDKHMTVLQTSKGPILETETTLPNGARTGRTFSFTVKCRNVGDANLDIPMVTLRDTGDAGLEFSLDGENFKTGEIKFLSLDNNGGFNAIEAGKEAITTVYCRVPSDANAVKISTRANTPNDIMAKYTNEVDDVLKSDLIPVSVTDEELTGISAEIGATNGEFIRNLTSLAKSLEEYGLIIQDVDDLASGIIENIICSETTSEMEYPQDIISSYATTENSEELDGEYSNNPSDTSLDPRPYRCATNLYLFTPSSSSGIWLKVSSSKKLNLKNKRIAIICHGHQNSVRELWVLQMANALYHSKQFDYVLAINWEDGASQYGSIFAVNTTHVIEYVADETVKILSSKNATPSKITLIGHSHGAHVSGHIANKMGAKRHIGLDTSASTVHVGNSLHWRNFPRTEYYRTSGIMGCALPYAKYNYIVCENGGFKSFSGLNAHSYAYKWFTHTINSESCRNNKIGFWSEHSDSLNNATNGKLSAQKGRYLGVINGDDKFEFIYRYNDNNYSPNKTINYPGNKSSWDSMLNSWKFSYDVSNENFHTDISDNSKFYTGVTYSRFMKFIDKSVYDKMSLPYELRAGRYYLDISLVIPSTESDSEMSIPIYRGNPEKVEPSFKFDIQIPHKYKNRTLGVDENGNPKEELAYLRATAMPSSIENGADNLAEYMYSSRCGRANEIYPDDNTVEIPIRIIQGENPIAKINGCSLDGFILSEKFEYTQEKYDSLKSSGDTTTSFKLNGDADLSPEKNPIESWFWHNKAETQNTSIEISKVDSGRYPVALIVKDSAGKYDSVSGFVEVKVFVDGEEKETPLPESIDPNEMSGPAGVGDDRKVLPGQWLDFKIHFENHSDATAAAQEIHVTNMLSNYLDWNTFELGEIVFKNQIVTSLSGKNSGSAEVALSDGSQNVRMEFSLDPVTGKAYWYMRSVDPNTADGWPLDPYAGFLPPNDANGNGEGYVAYRVKVKDDAPNGAMVDSTASIIFDYNEPIQTDPSWSNTVYVGAPSKPELITIGEIVNGSTTLSWTAADFASSYDVYIWENGTERPSEATISDIQSTSISFNLEYINGNSYNFLVVAKNKYGETQSQISTAETKKVETYAKWSADNLIGFTADKRAKNVSSYNDNITNLEKYVFGLSGQKPTSFNENGNFKTYVGDDGVVRVRYPMRRYMSDASVKVSYSTDLKTWKTDQISTTLISEDEEISIYESELGGNQPKNIWFKVEAKEKN